MIEIWHYPRCSKSRKTLALLEERGLEPTIRRYLEDPPDAQAIERVLEMLDMEPRELMRQKEDPYTVLGLADESTSREDLISAMVEHPILIQRPVVIVDDQAALGRPPENVLPLLSP